MKEKDEIEFGTGRWGVASPGTRRLTLGLWLAWVMLAPGAAALDSPSRLGASFDRSSMTWRIWNDHVKAEFRLTEQRAFHLVSLAAVGSRAWVAPAAAPVSPIFLRLNDAAVDENAAWRHVNTSSHPTGRDGVRQTITLQNDVARVQVALNLEVHPNHAFLRHWLEVKNVAADTRFLTAASPLRWRFDTAGELVMAFVVRQSRGGQPSDFDLNEIELAWLPEGISVVSGPYGKHCSWLALNTPQGFGLVAGWGFNGRAYIHARQRAVGEPLEIEGGPDELHLPLGPGQVQPLPAAFLGLFRGDWDEADYRTRRYVDAVLAHPLAPEKFASAR